MKLRKKMRASLDCSGLSLVEIIIGLAVVGIIASIGILSFHNVRNAVEADRLKGDVSRLNMAVSVYVGSGGKLQGVSDPKVVIRHLKTAVSGAQAKGFVGFKGASIDIDFQPITKSSTEHRGRCVAWDTSRLKFEILETPPPGGSEEVIVGFGRGAESELSDIERNQSIAYAQKGNWIWDYKDFQASTSGPSLPSVETESGSTLPTIPPAVIPRLIPPNFSLAGGQYPLQRYSDGSTVALTDPNPTGAASIFIEVDGKTKFYQRPFVLEPGLSIHAYAVSIDPDHFSDSILVSATYTTTPVALDVEISAPQTALSYQAVGGKMRGRSTSLPLSAIIELKNAGDIPGWLHEPGHYLLSTTANSALPHLTNPPGGGAPAKFDLPLSLDLWAPGQVTVRASASAKTLDKRYLSDSGDKSLTFTALSQPLGAPTLAHDPAQGRVSIVFAPGVPQPESSYIVYRIGNGSWRHYSSPFPVEGGDTVYSETRVPTNIRQWFVSGRDELGIPEKPEDFKRLAGGHFDLDTSTFVSRIGSGDTDGHEHEYNYKYNVAGADLLNLRSHKLDSLDDVVGQSQRFKIIVANGSLSPGARLFVNSQNQLDAGIGGVGADRYDDRALGDLPVYSLAGVPGSTRLEQLGVYFSEHAISNAEFVPTNTGDVKKNKPGPSGEWRNGALTIQAVAVDSRGQDAFATSQALSNGGVQGVATRGLLWEATLFWHWSGPSLHDRSPYVPGNPSTVARYVER